MTLETKRENKGEIARYLISGAFAVTIDSVVYWLLLSACGPSLAKAISFVSGTAAAYTLNKFWTFRKRDRDLTELLKFVCLYAVTLVINVLVNRLTLSFVPLLIPEIQPVIFPVAWLTATGTSTVLNFVGQKFWVFKQGR